MRPSSPRSSRISSTTARYSRSSSRIAPAVGISSVALLDLDAQPAARVGLGRAAHAAMQAGAAPTARAAAGQPHLVGHLGDRADLRVLALVLGHEHDAVLVPTSTVRVTFMFGKTTMSSSGTSSSFGTISSSGSKYKKYSDYAEKERRERKLQASDVPRANAANNCRALLSRASVTHSASGSATSSSAARPRRSCARPTGLLLRAVARALGGRAEPVLARARIDCREALQRRLGHAPGEHVRRRADPSGRT